MTDNDRQDHGYDASDITVLEGLDPVRHRPGMYIGSTDTVGLHHLAAELIDNAVDEAIAGFCSSIAVRIHHDGSMSVYDDGRGIPVDTHPKTGRSTLETVFTVLHAGGKFTKGAYKISGGLHGVGASIINALSTDLHVRVHRNGNIYYLAFRYGVPQGDIEIVGTTDHTGTVVQFWPDATIFDTITFQYNLVLQRLKQSAYLTPGVTFTLIDDRTHKQQRYRFDGGIDTQMHRMVGSKKVYSQRMHISTEQEDLAADIVCQVTDSSSDTMLSFVNNVITRDGGTHVTGFKNGYLKAINDIAKSMSLLDKKIGEFQLSDIIEGLYVIIAIKIPEPQFQGQTKGRLGNTYVRKVVEEMVYNSLYDYLLSHEQEAKNIIDRVSLSAKARIAAKLARETVLRKTPTVGGVLPGKLADCHTKKREQTELYIVEGDSAGGSAKQARNSGYQAILPLKGKILNTENINPQKMLQSKEVKSLIMAIGAGIKEAYEHDKLRYDKIIIMTDADVDGSHIRTLLLTFFFRYMRQLIDGGHLYIAVSPLYSVVKGKKGVKSYIYPPQTLEEGLAHLGYTSAQGLDVQRYKGLGELNPDQLRETTMDPATRKMLQVTIEDAVAADILFSALMGDDVAKRRNFILNHAQEVRELDI